MTSTGPAASPLASGLRTTSWESLLRPLRTVAAFEPKSTVAAERLTPLIVTSVPP